MTGLPEGWSIEKIEELGMKVVTGIYQAVEQCGSGLEPLDPKCIIDCDGAYYLVLDRSDSEWHMGLIGTDGIIECWASYGESLEAAIAAL